MSIFETIVSRELIDKGWSGDKKYRAVCGNGDVYLLRISPFEKREMRARLWEVLRDVQALDISMSRSLEMGECAEGIYFVQEWVEGTDAEEEVPKLERDIQYALGYDAGETLKKLHSLPAPEGRQPWGERFSAKALRKVRMYRDCPIKFKGAEAIIEYVENNLGLPEDRPQTFQHGDYHIGNMMLRDGRIVVIDFDRFDYGDPWEEFNRIVWCAQKAPVFATGMVDGYFSGKVPVEFWKLLMLYIGSNMLSSVPWAIPFGEKEINVMLDQAGDVLDWYEGMTCCVPKWYSR